MYLVCETVSHDKLICMVYVSYTVTVLGLSRTFSGCSECSEDWEGGGGGRGICLKGQPQATVLHWYGVLRLPVQADSWSRK